MNNTFFTDTEIATLVKTLGRRLQVSVNRAGNVKVINNEEPLQTRSFYVLHKFEDGTFMWRRHSENGYCYPLNMKGRKFVGTVHKFRHPETGKIEYCGYRPYTTKMSVFKTLDEAMEYFVEYLRKYRYVYI